MKLHLHCVAALCFSLLISTAFAQSAVELTTPDAFLPVRENGAKLRQAVFKASGTVTKSIPTINTQIADDPRARIEAMRNLTVEERQAEMKKRTEQMRRGANATMGTIAEGACDYDRKQFYFRVAHEIDAVEMDRDDLRIVPGMLGFPEVKFIARPDLNALSRQLLTRQYSTSLNPPETPLSSLMIRDDYVFNGRTMGWGGRHAFNAGLSDGNLDYFARLAYQNENFQTKLMTKDEETGLKRIEVTWSWVNADEINRIQTYWLDPNQGSQIVKFLDRTEVLNPTTQQHEQTNSKPALGEGTYSWEKIGDIWVVKTLDVMTRQSESSLNRWKLTFQWSSINQPVPDDMFDYRNWDLSDGGHVSDNRSGGGFPIPVKVEKNE